MSRIVVNISRKSNVLVGENALKKRLDDLAAQVDDVRSGLRYKISSSQQISAGLKKVAEDIRGESVAVHNLQGGFSQIFNLYEQAERKNAEELRTGHSDLLNAGHSEAERRRFAVEQIP